MKKDGQKNDYILITAAVLLLVISGAVVFWFSSQRMGRDLKITQNAPKIIGRAVLTINFGNGTKRAFEGDVVENETLLDALTLASKAGNFRYKLDKKMNLATIETFTATGERKWQWYINDKKINKPLSEVILNNADTILIKYE